MLFIRFEWFTPQSLIICLAYCINVISRHLFRVGQILDSHINLRLFEWNYLLSCEWRNDQWWVSFTILNISGRDIILDFEINYGNFLVLSHHLLWKSLRYRCFERWSVHFSTNIVLKSNKFIYFLNNHFRRHKKSTKIFMN